MDYIIALSSYVIFVPKEMKSRKSVIYTLTFFLTPTLQHDAWIKKAIFSQKVVYNGATSTMIWFLGTVSPTET
jgi:hypothetical protein